MRIHLAGIEWLHEAPAGNRLRWWYPIDEEIDGAYRGLPRTIVVQRAPVHEDIRPPDIGDGKTFPRAGNVPYSWWDNSGTVSVGGFALPNRHVLSSPVQGVRFTYRGPTTRMIIRDSEHDIELLDVTVADGETVYLEAAAINELLFFSFVAILDDFSTLDLFADRGLTWQSIAALNVSATLDATLGDVIERQGGASSLSDDQWRELTKMGEMAVASSPGDFKPGEPTRWQSFNLTLALRWEFAALCGLGIFDGPRTGTSPLDEIDTNAQLAGPHTTPLAYRVFDPERRDEPSNIVVCAPGMAPPLVVPGAPKYIDPQVRLNADGTFGTTVEMRWQQSDPRAIGVVFEEEISSSPTIGGVLISTSFEHRTRMAEDPPNEGRLARSFDVPFHDVTLKSRVRASDGWDRSSTHSGWSLSTALNLVHEPVAPGLRPGTYDGGSVTIPRQLGDPSVPDWTPDVIVEEAAGRLHVFRQVAQARLATGTTLLPTPIQGDRYSAHIAGVGNLSDFNGGYLIANGSKHVIVDVVGSEVMFDAPGAGHSGVILFPAGPVKLQQDDKHLSLWTQVADFSAVGLPDVLSFVDPVPGPTTTDVLSYVARVSYLGRYGPTSNVSQVIRVAPTPTAPPPFTVERLGVDFYDRTMVKIRLTNPVSAGRFTVWWAEGFQSDAQFADNAVPGEYGGQWAHGQRYLFDVLTLPVPQNQDRNVTVGVQAVNSAGGQSAFKTVPVVIPAAAP